MEEGTLLCNEDILGGHGSAGLLAPRGGGFRTHSGIIGAVAHSQGFESCEGSGRWGQRTGLRTSQHHAPNWSHYAPKEVRGDSGHATNTSDGSGRWGI